MDNTISFHGSNIHYRKTGEGFPVVLLHGFAEDSRIWDSVTELIPEKYLLIIPDIPGSGRSDILKNDKVQMEDLADCLHEILLAEKLNKVILIGHSMGGYISLAFAEKYSASLTGLGLFHSSAYADDEEKKQTRKKAIRFIQDNGADAFLQTSIPGLFKDAEQSRPEISDLLEKGRQFSAKALVQYYEAMISRPDRTGILKQATIPFLFIMGEHDKAVPFKHSLEQSQLPPLSYVYILRNSAHMGMLEETARSGKILAEFLQAIS